MQEAMKQSLSGTERDFKLRMSALGKPDRKLWLESRDAPREELHPNTLIKFMYGHVLEEVILYLAEEAGHEVTHQQAEVEIEGVLGHCDCLIDGWLIDVKTASPFGFKKFQDGSIRQDDPFGYLPQLAGYQKALQPKGSGLLAINKVSGALALCLFTFKELDDIPVEDIIARQKKVVGSDKIPEKCYPYVPEGKSGNQKLDMPCHYCDYKFDCHKDANNGNGLRTFIYSNGPVYLAQVKKEPRVSEAFPPIPTKKKD